MISDLSPGDLVRVTQYSSSSVRMVVKVKHVTNAKAYVAILAADREPVEIGGGGVLWDEPGADTYERITPDQLTDEEHQAIAERALLNGAG